LGLSFVVILFLALSFIPETGRILNQKNATLSLWGDAVELKRAGLWLKENAKSPAVLMSYNKAVDFYAGIYDIRSGASLSNDDFHRVLAYARHRKVEYMVLAERYASRFPKLDFLLQGTDFPEELDLIYEDTELPGAKVRIFRILKRASTSENGIVKPCHH
jgi:hypothetical protein